MRLEPNPRLLCCPSAACVCAYAVTVILGAVTTTYVAPPASDGALTAGFAPCVIPPGTAPGLGGTATVIISAINRGGAGPASAAFNVSVPPSGSRVSLVGVVQGGPPFECTKPGASTAAFIDSGGSRPLSLASR